MRMRIERAVDQHAETYAEGLREVFARIGQSVPVDHSRDRAEIKRFRHMLLANAGYSDPVAYAANRVVTQMAGPIPSKLDQRRQWWVLAGAAAGVILLALSKGES